MNEYPPGVRVLASVEPLYEVKMPVSGAPAPVGLPAGEAGPVAGAPTLPPLPEPDNHGHTEDDVFVGYYTDDQMHAYAAAAVAAAVPQWQPIETAPRGSGEDGPSSTKHPDYVEPPKLLLWTAEGPTVGYYDWFYHPGYGRGADLNESPWRSVDGGQAYGPTHWMPLPAAPEVPR